MTNKEMVDKIVEKLGITREQAEQALEMHGGDLLDAMIYVERTYKNGNDYASSSFSTNANYSAHTAPEQQSVNFNQQAYTNPNTGFNQGGFNVNGQKNPSLNAKSFGDTVKEILNFLVNNGISIYHNEKELVTVPILVWLVLFFSSISTLVMVMFITMFFNVRYSFKGSELGNSKINGAMSGIYMFVQSLKARIFS